MNKSLLITTLCLTSIYVTRAGENRLIDDFYVMAISPDGRYAVSQGYTGLTFMDLSDGRTVSFDSDDNTEYTVGFGNCVTADGRFVGSATAGDGLLDLAGLYDGNSWVTICPQSAYETSYAWGITPDGSRICGIVSNPDNTSGTDGLLRVPAIWEDLNADGVYEITLLPHPDTDFTGRPLQYATAVSISDDGHTVAGQITDHSGMMNSPIIYRQNADGEWSYSILGEELINPAHTEFGPEPVRPEPTDYMDAAQKEAYEKALGGGQKPSPEDYMSAEKREQYRADATAYNEESKAYRQLVRDVISASVKFDFNNVVMSGNGRYYASGAVGEEGYDFRPYVFDITDATHRRFDLDAEPRCAISDGTVTASTDIYTTPMRSFILTPEASAFVPLEDYVKTEDESVYRWMAENLSHDFTVVDPESGEESVIRDVIATGHAFISSDRARIIGAQWCLWDDGDGMVPYQTYVLDLPSHSAIKGIESDPADISVTVTGSVMLTLTGNVSSLEIHDPAGRRLYTKANPSATVTPGLGHGTYIISAYAADGRGCVKKVIF